ncbi:MAG TPA: 30S ribosomal protein S13 [Methanomicrobia archaeon]|nr:30S ribosomal protein S13 [Methanomicrobia archaeon]
MTEEVVKGAQAKQTKAKATGRAKERGKEKVKESEAENADFKHIVRILDTDLDGNRKVVHALCGVKGIGQRVARVLVAHTSVDPNQKMGNLSDDDIEQLKSAITGVEKRLPQWMLNRRKDILTGDDKHIMGADQVLQLREDVNLLRKIRSYRGIRHERGLKARGQRTRSTGRRGLVVGVIRRKQLAAKGGK